MTFDIWTVIQVVPLLVLLYYYINRKYSFWSSRGVKGPAAIFPFGYNLTKALNRPDEIELQWQQQYGKLYGVYTGLTPTLTVCDHELIKQVLLKDFHQFVNRRSLNPFHHVWNLNLFFSENEDWKRIRSITSPAFTSGKLRTMYPIMGECIHRLTSFFGKTANNGNGVFNTKEVMAGFTIDVIASTSFATQTSANDESRDTQSPFVFHGLNLFKFNPFKVMSTMTLPRPVLNLLKIETFFPDNSFQFILDLTSKIVEQRKENPGKASRHDLIQLMMDSFAYEEDLKDDNDNSYSKLTATMDLEDDKEEIGKPKIAATNKTKKTLTEKEIIAQCILFFVAGFETTATTLTHVLYELAQNPDVQQRLFEEIEQEMDGVDPHNEAVYYDRILNNIPYLDAVAKEALRKYPPVVRLERRVGQDGVKLAGIPLDKSVLIEIPTVAVQRNPEYYPDPLRFNPDRFLPENKHLLVPYTYIPFGDGPRNCLGMRFAYQEIKLCVASVVRQFRIEPTAQTPDKLIIRRGNLLLNCIPFELKVSTR